MFKNGLIKVAAGAAFPYSDGLASAASFISKYGDQVQMWRRVGDTIFLPRRMTDLQTLDPEKDARVKGAPVQMIAPPLSPRNDDQQQVLDASYGLLSKGIDHVVQAPTGWGKTWLGISLGLKLQTPTLIVVTKQDLIESWTKTVVNPPTAEGERGMGLPPSILGHAQADILRFQGCWFVIAMIHSLIRPGKYPPEFWNYFGLTIFDEVHHLAADSFQDACYLAPSRLRLGLSATPERSDGKTKVITNHIGPVMVKGTKLPMRPKVLVRETNWFIPDDVPYGPGSMGIVLGIMARNKVRNQHIVKFALEALNAGRTVVIMSDLVDGHLRPLFHQLCAVGVSGADIGFYIGQKGSNRLKNKLALEDAKSKRVVLATYQMCKEGTDVPHWDTLVLATPKADAEQAVGRILRSADGKKQPVVLDLLDSSKILQGFYLKRLAMYHRLGAQIIRMVGE